MWPLRLTALGSASPSGSGGADSLPVSSPGASREGRGAWAGGGEAESLGHREMISHWWKAADLSMCAQPQACPPPPPYVTQGLEGKVDLALMFSKRQWPRASLFLIVHVHTASPRSPDPQAPYSRIAHIYKTGTRKDKWVTHPEGNHSGVFRDHPTQRFSTREDSASRGHLATSGEIFGCQERNERWCSWHPRE